MSPPSQQQASSTPQNCTQHQTIRTADGTFQRQTAAIIPQQRNQPVRRCTCGYHTHSKARNPRSSAAGTISPWCAWPSRFEPHHLTAGRVTRDSCQRTSTRCTVPALTAVRAAADPGSATLLRCGFAQRPTQAGHRHAFPARHLDMHVDMHVPHKRVVLRGAAVCRVSCGHCSTPTYAALASAVLAMHRTTMLYQQVAMKRHSSGCSP